jgi:probable F420-dependent oxidoreductase
MKFGLQITPTDGGIAPDVLGRAAEERGFSYLSVAEHTHIPLSSVSPRSPGGVVPEQYKHCHDPFVWLTAVAAATERLLVGTGVCLVAQRDPISLAKQVASLDRLSGGRVVFGIGYGWNLAEARSHGVGLKDRRPVLREKVLALKALWTEDVAEFDGEHVKFPPSWSWPKPLQSPHPPIFLGAPAGPKTFSHVVELCDGWMPFDIRAEDISALHEAAEAAGRDPSSITLTAHRAPTHIGELERLAGIGVDRASLYLPPEPEHVLLPLLDELATIAEKVTGGG